MPLVSFLDLILLVLAAAAFVVGFWKGLLRIVIGLASLVAAFIVASRLADVGAGWFAWAGWSGEVRHLLGYVLLFVGVLIAGGVLAWLARGLAKAAQLGCVDRVAGASLALLAAILGTSFLVLPLVAWSPAGAEALSRSKLAPYLAAVADLAARVVPDELETRYREGVETLRKRWRGEVGREVVRIRHEGGGHGASGGGGGA